MNGFASAPAFIADILAAVLQSYQSKVVEPQCLWLVFRQIKLMR
jgi:uncharacterized MAPEG superfamily protein